jgi:hypothetical protein
VKAKKALDFTFKVFMSLTVAGATGGLLYLAAELFLLEMQAVSLSGLTTAMFMMFLFAIPAITYALYAVLVASWYLVPIATIALWTSEKWVINRALLKRLVYLSVGIVGGYAAFFIDSHNLFDSGIMQRFPFGDAQTITFSGDIRYPEVIFIFSALVASYISYRLSGFTFFPERIVNIPELRVRFDR